MITGVYFTPWRSHSSAEYDLLSTTLCRARKWVDENLNFDKQAKLSLFETTIRIVGGLLSAFDLSDDGMFLEKARKLVDMLMPAFYTATTGEISRNLPHPPFTCHLPS